MKYMARMCLVLFAMTSTIRADESMAELRVGNETFVKVTITGVTATDLYFSHAGGMGNAKLKNLDPEMQQHFKFDPIKAQEIEKDRAIPYKPLVSEPGPGENRRGFGSSKPSTPLSFWERLTLRIGITIVLGALGWVFGRRNCPA